MSPTASTRTIALAPNFAQGFKMVPARSAERAPDAARTRGKHTIATPACRQIMVARIVRKAQLPLSNRGAGKAATKVAEKARAKANTSDQKKGTSEIAGTR